MGLANKSFFQLACYLCLGSVPICPKRLISGGRSGIKALPSQRPGYRGGILPPFPESKSRNRCCIQLSQTASNCPKVPRIKILTQTLHSIEPSSLKQPQTVPKCPLHPESKSWPRRCICIQLSQAALETASNGLYEAASIGLQVALEISYRLLSPNRQFPHSITHQCHIH